jgi:threonine dehydrogenase-like Zn-dependent dehydrogenase
MQVARDLIANGQIDAPSLVTHRFGIDDFDSAIELVGDEEAIKVAVVP